MSRYRGKGSPDQGQMSDAEAELLKAIHREYANGHLSRRPFRDQWIPIKFTVPDLWFPPDVAVYLDGPYHRAKRAAENDDEVDERLRGFGVTVLRFPYEPPIGKRQLSEIVEHIKEAVNRPSHAGGIPHHW